MYIKRIQVEEGFLSGLSLDFGTGLNVLIGPRGAGKTSIIELIRFCLGAPAFTDKTGLAVAEHARSILGGGEVTITLSDGVQEVTVSRTASEERPRSTSQFVPPTILSQNEIESLGTDAVGRLRLLDAFRTDREALRATASRLRGDARALTVEAQGIAQEIESIDDQLAALARDITPLTALETEHQRQLAQLESAQAQHALLTKISDESARIGVRQALYQRTESAITSWAARLTQTADKAPFLETWPESAGGTDELREVRARTDAAADLLRQAQVHVEAATELVRGSARSAAEQKLGLEAQARSLRTELETLQEGSGATARRVAELREKAGQQQALKNLRLSLAERRTKVLNKRNGVLDELDVAGQREFDSRKAVADWLNAQLRPRIEVQIDRFGLPTAYVEAIRGALRGSGLKYTALANSIAENISPRELAVAAEDRSADTIAETLGLPLDRAARLLSEIRKAGAENIVVCDVQDTVVLKLLDGAEYKTSDRLSTGQRCTVILPLLLSRPEGVLIIDQPEDHLDNAFIVDTAVEAIRRRRPGTQLIFSTHNPNIPVLGSADRVILLGSDGRRGFVRHSGRLDETSSVRAITTVMEGGMDAFRRRSAFYDGASAVSSDSR